VTETYAQWQRFRACLRKRRHETRLDANAAVLAHWARGRWAWPLRCSWCDGWHVTSDESTREAR
jgi:hypothetical protein